MKKLPRAFLALIATISLSLAFSFGAAAQSASQPPAQDSAKQSSAPAPQQQIAQNNLPAPPDQQISLGELARAARAKKASESKAAKVIDDENIP